TSTRDDGSNASVLINGQTATVHGLTASLRSNSLDLQVDMTAAFGSATGTTTFGITGGGATFQLSPTVEAAGGSSLAIPSVSTGSLGRNDVGFLSSLGTGGDAAIGDGGASNAQEILSLAIKQVAIIRGRLGAFQKNVLDPNVNALQVALENVTASESAIRDADFASETAAMTRAQILVQANTAVLSMANAAPQSVLQLLK
ncbi:MAG: flagellin, partial [Phycisphaerae bacterium]|nr:flagellin [Phycisphaerae bacterium]